MSDPLVVTDSDRSTSPESTDSNNNSSTSSNVSFDESPVPIQQQQQTTPPDPARSTTTSGGRGETDLWENFGEEGSPTSQKPDGQTKGAVDSNPKKEVAQPSLVIPEASDDQALRKMLLQIDRDSKKLAESLQTVCAENARLSDQNSDLYRQLDATVKAPLGKGTILEELNQHDNFGGWFSGGKSNTVKTLNEKLSALEYEYREYRANYTTSIPEVTALLEEFKRVHATSSRLASEFKEKLLQHQTLVVNSPLGTGGSSSAGGEGRSAEISQLHEENKVLRTDLADAKQTILQLMTGASQDQPVTKSGDESAALSHQIEEFKNELQMVKKQKEALEQQIADGVSTQLSSVRDLDAANQHLKQEVSRLNAELETVQKSGDAPRQDSFTHDFAALQEKYLNAQEKIAEMEGRTGGDVSLEKYSELEVDYQKLLDDHNLLIQGYERLKKSSEQKIESLNQEVQSHQEAMTAMSAQLGSSPQSKRDLEVATDKLQRVEEELASQSTELSREKSSADELRALQEESTKTIASLEVTNRQLQDRLEEINSGRADTESENEHLLAQLSTATLAKTALEEEAKATEQAMQKLRSEAEQSQLLAESIRQEKEELHQLVEAKDLELKDSSEMNGKLQEQSELLKQELDRLDTECQVIREQLVQSETKIAETELERADAYTALESLSTENEALKAAATSVSTDQLALTAAETTITTLKSNIDDQEALVADLRTRLSQAQDTLTICEQQKEEMNQILTLKEKELDAARVHSEAEVAALTNRIAEFEKTTVSSETLVTETRAHLVDTEEKLSDTSKDLARANEELSVIRDQMSQLETEVSNRQALLDNQTQQLDEFKQALAVKEEEAASQSAAQNEIEISASVRTSELESKIVSLETDLERLKVTALEEEERLNAQIGAQQRSIDELSGNLLKAESLIDDLKKQGSSVNESHQQQVAEQQASIFSLKQELEDASSAKTLALQESQEALSKFQNELDSKDAELKLLRQQLDEASAACTTQQEKLKAAETLKEDCISAQSSLTGVTEQLKISESKVSSLEETISEMKSERVVKEEKMKEQLKKSLDRQSTLMNEAKEAKEELAKQQQIVADFETQTIPHLQSQKKELEEQLALARSSADSFTEGEAKAQAECIELRRQLRDAEGEQSSYEQKLTTRDETIVSLEAALKDQALALEEMKEESSRAQTLIEGLKEEAQELRMKLSDSESRVAQLSADFAAEQQKLELVRSNHSALGEKETELQLQIANMQSELREITSARDVAETEKAKLLSELEKCETSLKEQLFESDSEVQRLKEAASLMEEAGEVERATHAASIAATQQEISRLEEELRVQKTQITSEQSTVAELSAEIASLRAAMTESGNTSEVALAAIKTELDGTKDELEQLKSEAQLKETKNAELSSIAESLTSSMKERDSLIETQKEELRVLSDTLVERETQLAESKCEIESARQKMQGLENEISSLGEQLEGMKITMAAPTQPDEHATQLQEDFVATKEKMEQLLQAAEVDQVKIDELTRMVTTTEAELQTVAASRDELSDALDAQKQECELQTCEIVELRDRLDADSSSGESLKMELAAVQTDLEAAREEITQREADSQKHSEQLASLEAEKSKLIADLEVKVKEIEGLGPQQRVDDETHESQLGVQITALHEQLSDERSESQSKITSLQEKADELQIRVEDAERERDTYSNLIVQAKTEAAELKIDLKAAQAAEERLANKLATLQTECGNSADLETSLAQRDQKIESLREELKQVREELATSTAKLHESEESLTLTRDQLELLQAKKSEMSAELESHREETVARSVSAAPVHGELVAENEALLVKVEQLETENFTLQTALEAAKPSTGTSDTLEEQLAQLTVDRTSLSARVDELEQEQYSYEVKFRDAEDTVEALEKRCQELESEKEKLAVDLAKAISDHSRAVEEGKELQGRLDTISQEVARGGLVAQQLKLVTSEKEMLEKIASEKATEIVSLKNRLLELEASQRPFVTEAASPLPKGTPSAYVMPPQPSQVVTINELEEKLENVMNQLNTERNARANEKKELERKIEFMKKKLRSLNNETESMCSAVPSVATSAATEKTRARKKAEGEAERLRAQMQHDFVPIQRYHALKVECDKLREQKRRLQSSADHQDPWRAARSMRPEYGSPAYFGGGQENSDLSTARAEKRSQDQLDALKRSLEIVLAERDQLQGKVKIFEESQVHHESMNNSAAASTVQSEGIPSFHSNGEDAPASTRSSAGPSSPTRPMISLDKYNALLRQNEVLTERIEAYSSPLDPHPRARDGQDVELKEKYLRLKSKEQDAIREANDVKSQLVSMKDKLVAVEFELEETKERLVDAEAALANSTQADSPRDLQSNPSLSSTRGQFDLLQIKYGEALEKLADGEVHRDSVIVALEKELKETRDKLDEAESALAQVQATSASTTESDALNSTKAQFELLQVKHAEALAKLADAEVSEASKKEDSAAEENASRQMALLEQKNEILTDELRSSMNECENLKQKAEQLEEDALVLQGALEAMKSQTGTSDALETQIAELNLEKASIQEKLDAAESDNFQMSVQITELNQQLDEAVSGVTEKSAEQHTLATEVDAKAHEIEVLSENLEQLREEVEDLNEKIKVYQGEQEALLSRLTQSEADKLQLSGQISELTEGMEAAQSQISTLEEALQTATQSKEELAGIESEAKSQLLTEKEALETELKQVQAQVELLSAEIKEKETLLSESLATSAAATAALSEEQGATIDELNSEIVKKATDLSTLESRVADLESQNTELSKKNEDLEIELGARGARIAELEAGAAPSVSGVRADAPSTTVNEAETISHHHHIRKGARRAGRRNRGKNLLDSDDQQEDPGANLAQATQEETTVNTGSSAPSDTLAPPHRGHSRSPSAGSNAPDLETERKKHQEQLQHYIAETSRLSEDLQALEDQLASKESEVERLRKDNSELQDEVNSLVSGRNEMETKMKDLQNRVDLVEISGAGARAASAEPEISHQLQPSRHGPAEVKEMKSRVESLERKLQEAQDQAARSAFELDVQLDFGDQYQDEISRLKKKARGEDPDELFFPIERKKKPEHISARKSMTPPPSDQVDALERKIAVLQKANAQLEDRLSAKQAEGGDLLSQQLKEAQATQNRITKAEKSVEAAKKKLKEYQEEIKRLTSAMRPLKLKLADYEALGDRLNIPYPIPEQLNSNIAMRLSLASNSSSAAASAAGEAIVGSRNESTGSFGERSGSRNPAPSTREPSSSRPRAKPEADSMSSASPKPTAESPAGRPPRSSQTPPAEIKDTKELPKPTAVVDDIEKEEDHQAVVATSPGGPPKDGPRIRPTRRRGGAEGRSRRSQQSASLEDDDPR